MVKIEIFLNRELLINLISVGGMRRKNGELGGWINGIEKLFLTPHFVPIQIFLRCEKLKFIEIIKKSMTGNFGFRCKIKKFARNKFTRLIFAH